MRELVTVLESLQLGKETRLLTVGPVPSWKGWPHISLDGAKTAKAGAGGGANAKWAKNGACYMA